MLKNKNLTFGGKFYLLKSPRDENLSASTTYREFLKRDFDLVLVENGYPLEPNYVIIDPITIKVDNRTVRDLNLPRSKYDPN